MRSRAALAAAGVVAATPAWAGSYTYTTIDPPGAQYTYPAAINDVGDVVGYFRPGSGLPAATTGFVWRNGAATVVSAPSVYPLTGTFLLDVGNAGIAVGLYGNDQGVTRPLFYRTRDGSFGSPDRNSSAAAIIELLAINNRKVAIGSVSRNLGQSVHGFILSGSSKTEVTVPGSKVVVLEGISDTGAILGNYYTQGPHDFVLANGSRTDIGAPPGSSASAATSIGDDGKVVGWAQFATGVSGFVYDASGYKVFSYPGATETKPVARNASGLYGTYLAGSTVLYRGFVQSGGTYHSISVPGSTVTLISAANRVGAFVGTYLDSVGGNHGFLATCAADQAPCTQ